MVMDANNGGFPIPVQREVGGLIFEDIQMIDYPFFVDVRGEGFVGKHPIVQNLDQMTFAWGSPLSIDAEINAEREVIEILKSSDQSWTHTSPQVMPKMSQDLSGGPLYAPGADVGSKLLAVSLKGKFASFFEESPLLVEARERAAAEAAEKAASESKEIEPSEEGENTNEEELDDEALMAELQELQSGDEEEIDEADLGVIGAVVSSSPESARLVVLGSSDSLSDTVINMISQTRGSLYSNTMQFVANVIDVSMEDASLLQIRSRGHFNRTLKPLDEVQQKTMEYLNYIFAIVSLMIVFGVNYVLQRVSQTRRGQSFGVNQ